MEQNFRIKPGTERAVTKKNMKLLLWILTTMNLALFSIPVIRSIKTDRISSFDALVSIVILLLPAIMYYLNFSFHCLLNKCRTIGINNLGIEERFEITVEALSRIEQYLLWRNKKVFRAQFFRWDEIVKVQNFRHNLLIKNKIGANRKIGGVISIPKDLGNFEVAEQLIKKYTSGLNN